MSAVQIDSYDYPISGVTIRVVRDAVLDSPYSAFELVSGGGQGLPITGLTISHVLVDGTGTVVFQAETAGSAYVAHVTARNIGVAGTVQASTRPPPRRSPSISVQATAAGALRPRSATSRPRSRPCRKSLSLTRN